MLLCSTAKDIGSNNPVGATKSLADYKRLAAEVYGVKGEAFLKAWPASSDAEAVKQAYEVVKNSGFGLSDRDTALLQIDHRLKSVCSLAATANASLGKSRGTTLPSAEIRDRSYMERGASWKNRWYGWFPAATDARATAKQSQK